MEKAAVLQIYKLRATASWYQNILLNKRSLSDESDLCRATIRVFVSCNTKNDVCHMYRVKNKYTAASPQRPSFEKLVAS